MTRAIRDRILKDANGDISDHLRNHIHLTNCIHLKNHMHKQSPILTDRSLMRDLIVLQRSRSLRDPSASPRSWHSPSIVDLLPRKGENEFMIREGRRSVDIERPREGRRSVDIERPRESRRLSVRSPPLASSRGSKLVPGELGEGNDRVAAVSDRSSKSVVRTARRIRREESGHRSDRIGLGGENDEPRQGIDGDSLARDSVSIKSESKDQGSKERERRISEAEAKTLSEQLHDIHFKSDGMGSSNIQHNGKHSWQNKVGDGANIGIHGYNTGRNRAKRRKFRGARRSRPALSQRDVEGQSELSVASNTLAQCSGNPMYQLEDRGAECGEKNVTEGPKNGCGIPWNWSSIHHRGKSILDMAGRSFTCGLSEPRLRRGSTGRDGADLPVFSDISSSSAKSDAEALPLLVEASGSQGSSGNAGWVHDYSGELGIFADRLLKNDVDSDLASEARSGDQHKSRGYNQSRHQNLTQKYMPRTFRDLVGQNLVMQALSNAVMRKKVGLLYVFYGPHGTGKTSCARIFARALNCQSTEHPKPCGFCDSCIAHDMGKSRNIKEVGPVSNFDFESILDLLDNMTVSQLPSQYRVFIFDDCDTLSPDCWSAISKVIDRAPRRVVFVLICSSLDVLPHITISRCQKFFFPKLKDADIIYTLQWIATKEDLEIDKDALKLIASRSDGSLRDAEMTLEQLSLLGQKVTISLVQELVGLISDEKLVHLLDLALSADTVNTVKNLRVIMETGVEPLALMSQLATVITDILAGSYDFAKEGSRMRFFRRFPLAKEDMEKLRQALKTLSEAEKQLRMSNDKLTWLTAALLQLAPDQQYMLPTSSADTSFNHSPLNLNNAQGHGGMPYNGKKMSTSGVGIDRRRDAAGRTAPQQASATSTDMVVVPARPSTGRKHKGTEEIWLEVLERIQSNAIKEFLFREGKLISVTFGAAPTVQLLFSSYITKSTAEKFSSHILQAFETVLRSPVTIEIRCESTKDARAASEASRDGSFPMAANLASTSLVDNLSQILQGKSLDRGRKEIVEIDESPRVPEGSDHADKSSALVRRSSGSTRSGHVEAPHKRLTASTSGRKRIGEQSQSLSLVKGKVSLAHVIQQAEGCPQRNGWSKRKAVSIAEKLEQENLRLEPRSRSLLCWKTSRVTPRKLSRLKIRTRRPQSLLKLVSCGKCLSSKSPR